MSYTRVASLNVCSLVPKREYVSQLLDRERLDILCISETFLNKKVDNTHCRITGYQFVRRDYRGRCSGVGVYIRDGMKFKTIPLSSALEQVAVVIEHDGSKIAIVTVYRNHDVGLDWFYSEMEKIVSSMFLICEKIIILGDMNIDLNKDNLNVVTYSTFLTELGLKQLIKVSTRRGAVLDHIVVSDDVVVVESGVRDCHFSDHDLIFCDVKFQKPKHKPVILNCRDFKDFHHETFLHCLTNSDLERIYYVTDLDEKVSILNTTLHNLFDVFAPYKMKKIAGRPRSWMTDNIKEMISLRNKAKLKCRRSMTEGSWQYYRRLRNLVTAAIDSEKKAYFEYRLRLSRPKELYRELRINDIGSFKKRNEIPQALRNVSELNRYFVDCVPRSTVDGSYKDYYSGFRHCERFEFRTVDVDAVAECLKCIKSDASGADGITLKMIHLCTPYIVGFVTNIVNTCILENRFPTSWKTGIVTPLPKVAEPASFGQIRPITLLPVFSKVLEKVLHAQLMEFFESNEVLPEVQSGFRREYSCLTALTKISDDILRSVDDGKYTVLVLLDFSKAFDTVHHDILLGILEYVGMGHGALLLLKNYLIGRQQRVKISEDLSESLGLPTGVPQGSVLGPILYSIYTHLFPKVLKSCSVHMYADDIQLYFSFDKSNVSEANLLINEDLKRLYAIAKSHNLNVNPKKSKAIVFGSPLSVNYVEENLSLHISDAPILIEKQVNNLGLIMDNSFRYRSHVSRCLQRGYNNLRNLYPHKHILSHSVKLLLCNSIVLSQLQYCSQMYSPALDNEYRTKVQRLQNSCLRFIYGIRKYEHISHKLKEAGWLGMADKFKFQRLCFYHRIVSKMKPRYLYNKIRYRTDIHNVNIRKKNMIDLPKYRLSLYKRSFSYTISVEYNSLPSELKNMSCLRFGKHLFQFLMTQGR